MDMDEINAQLEANICPICLQAFSGPLDLVKHVFHIHVPEESKTVMKQSKKLKRSCDRKTNEKVIYETKNLIQQAQRRLKRGCDKERLKNVSQNETFDRNQDKLPHSIDPEQSISAGGTVETNQVNELQKLQILKKQEVTWKAEEARNRRNLQM